MSAQLPLFARGAHRRRDPDAAVAAAQSVELAPLEELVLSILQRRPSGLTTHELADVLQLSLVTVSPRMRPLVRRGAVIDSGERRKNVSGRASIVWKAVNDPCATRTGRRNDDLERMGTRRGESAS